LQLAKIWFFIYLLFRYFTYFIAYAAIFVLDFLLFSKLKKKSNFEKNPVSDFKFKKNK
jgi:hypothetical protein